ncbi:unnamed protein product [Ambrosiozyma monospora]|uniref:Unnamed protein product n=1 Tax=Ambrosiozyma monospora TaxID=43982 RepID=A0A9W7DKL6_AMBMO|nr:unnamed protein product [Ambrosiozyma monospora]
MKLSVTLLAVKVQNIQRIDRDQYFECNEFRPIMMLRTGFSKTATLTSSKFLFKASRQQLKVQAQTQLRYSHNSSSKSKYHYQYQRFRNTILGVTSFAIAASATLALSSTVCNEAPQTPPRKVSVEEFVKHNKPDDCWIVVNGQVYDFTDFIAHHPGGRFPLIRNAGHDASETFNKLHAKGTIEMNLPRDKHIGEIDGEAPVLEVELDDFELARQENVANLPPLGLITNVHDFEHVAKNVLSKGAWAYYSSGADDEITLRENHYAYQRIYFRPRILVDVKKIDTSTTLLGTPTSVPFYRCW